MAWNGKNYMTDGGDTLHIGGKLEVANDATVTGIVPQGVAVADAAGAAPTAAEFKALLDSLRGAGLIATSS